MSKLTINQNTFEHSSQEIVVLKSISNVVEEDWFHVQQISFKKYLNQDLVTFSHMNITDTDAFDMSKTYKDNTNGQTISSKHLLFLYILDTNYTIRKINDTIVDNRSKMEFCSDGNWLKCRICIL